MQVELRGIHKRFGTVHANNDITVTFAEGRIVGVLGENGAGKSTLMKILSGYQRADAGEILLDGQPAGFFDPLSAITNGIGMLQQDPLDIGAFSALENFIYGGLATGSRSAARAKLVGLCERFGFDINPDTPAAYLSIAQRQQLEIVRLLSLNVKLLILDEPTTGISAEQKGLLFSALRTLAERDRLIVLLVSHKLEDVIALCDEVIVLRTGKLVGGLPMPAAPVQLVELMFGTAMTPPKRHAGTLRPDAPTALALKAVALAGGRVKVEHFDLRVRTGEIIGFAGLEGSGQELALRACAGLVRPSHGTVHLKDKPMTGKPYRDFLANGVAFAAAGRLEEGLVAGLTITEHMALAHEREPVVQWERARQTTETQIAHYQVRGRPESRIEALSGGNQQRVLMALLPENPTALILEQPTRGLDIDSARWIWQQLNEKRERGAAIVFSSAELDEIIAYSDRIIVFYAGQPHEIADVSAVTIEQLGFLIGGKRAAMESGVEA